MLKMKNALLKFCISVVLLTLSTFTQADPTSGWAAFRQGNFQKAFLDCKEPAEKGVASCQALLGTLYKYGNGVSQDNSLSLKWLQSSADQGDPGGLEILGDTLVSGFNGVPRNTALAYELFMKSSRKGSNWADNQLGGMHRFGIHVTKNLAEALRYFQFAAGKGNPAAQANLADMYRLGDGVPKNPDLAFQWAMKSSEQKWPSGLNQLGVLFRDGIGVRQDSERAIALFKEAANTNRSPVSFSNLGRMYLFGTGISVNIPEARKWLETGIKFNDGDSFALLSDIHIRLAKDSPADAAKAFEYAQKAAMLNRSGGFNLLGFAYREGIGHPVDYPNAILNLKKGIELGNPNSMVHLATMYDKGLGVPKNTQEALSLYQRALSFSTLGQGNRKTAEDYVIKAATQQNQLPQSTQTAQASSPTAVKPPTVSVAPPQAGNSGAKDDKLTVELLDRLEKMQQQLSAIQSASNTAAVQTAVATQKIVFANRRALVIGNDNYKNVSKLNNATSDAKAMSTALTALGFKVTVFLDIDERAFKQALREFKMSIQGGDEVLVFFAGHGVQLGATNYLLPTDIKGDNEEQVKDEAIQLQRILDDLQERKAKFSLAIIDACRDNPFKGSGRALGGRGLAPTTAATGQMVMFSAGTGQQALDKLGQNDKDKNGLFTRILLKEMNKPGIPVDRVLRNVRNEVVALAKSVGHEQTPALYDQAVGEFFFKN
jgi:TPR repeat protein